MIRVGLDGSVFIVGARQDRSSTMGDRRSDKEPSPGPKALPWGMDKAEMQPGSFASLTDDKLARFVIGQQKKTKFAKVRHKNGQAGKDAVLTWLYCDCRRSERTVSCARSRRMQRLPRSTPPSWRPSRPKMRRSARRLCEEWCVWTSIVSSLRMDCVLMQNCVCEYYSLITWSQAAVSPSGSIRLERSIA